MTDTINRPMLAVAIKDTSSLKYPVYCTPKIDGIRCLKVNGNVVTRNLKPFPNNFIRNKLTALCPDGFDGEIVVPGKTFNEIQSLVMTQEGEPDFMYCVFDYVSSTLKEPYKSRMLNLNIWELQNYKRIKDEVNIQFLFPEHCGSEDELMLIEQRYLKQGYEGAMIRDPIGPYKLGRSTLREGYLLKLKRFGDSEATILDFEEKMLNQNSKEVSELGLSKRSTHLEGMTPADTLGSLLVKDLYSNQIFYIGSGLNDDLRKEIWHNRDNYKGKTITYKFQSIGMKEGGLPRFPIFKSFRSDLL